MGEQSDHKRVCAAQEIEMASSRGSAKKKKENQGVHWPDGGCQA